MALYTRDGKVWLSQKQIAELFGTSVPSISMHISKILKEGELGASSVIKNYLTTASDGKQYDVIYYSLEMILAIVRLVTRFLEPAELRVMERKDLTLDFWRENVKMRLTFQGKELLMGNRSVSNAQMEEYVRSVYEKFDGKRKAYEAQLADEEDMKLLDDLEDEVKNR